MYTGLNQIEGEIETSTKLFTSKEINTLRINPYAKSMSSKGITYTDEFKECFIEHTLDERFPIEIFQDCCFSIKVKNTSYKTCKKTIVSVL